MAVIVAVTILFIESCKKEAVFQKKNSSKSWKEGGM